MKIINDNRLLKTIPYRIAYKLKDNLDKIEIISEYIYENIDTKKDVDLLCSGSSGCVIATMIFNYLQSKNIDSRICYFKLNNESMYSNSNRISKNANYIIVDDFIQTASTINGIYKEFKEIAIKNKMKSKIHILAVSGSVWINQLDFKPKIVISGRYKDKND